MWYWKYPEFPARRHIIPQEYKETLEPYVYSYLYKYKLHLSRKKHRGSQMCTHMHTHRHTLADIHAFFIVYISETRTHFCTHTHECIYLGTHPLGVLTAAVWSALERMCESRGFILGVEGCNSWSCVLTFCYIIALPYVTWADPFNWNDWAEFADTSLQRHWLSV